MEIYIAGLAIAVLILVVSIWVMLPEEPSEPISKQVMKFRMSLWLKELENAQDLEDKKNNVIRW